MFLNNNDSAVFVISMMRLLQFWVQNFRNDVLGRKCQTLHTNILHVSFLLINTNTLQE